MYLIVLTSLLCLSKALAFQNLQEDKDNGYYEAEPVYNIHGWIQQLQLQTCALVAIGLKYFALFVENITESKNGTLKSTKFFLGICHQSTLEQWDFCSKKIGQETYQSRIHRRFCDFNVMVENKDCNCNSFILEQESFKVRGFPTCYFSPLPNSLCKYNVCGLSKCSPFTAQNLLHSVECDSNCKSHNPFCEESSFRSSSPPNIHSRWSKWSHLKTDVADNSESRPNRSLNTLAKSKKHHLVATCINKYKNKPDLDCLGPGTGCCPEDITNCTCRTYEEGYSLKLEKIYYVETKREAPLIGYKKNRRKKSYRLLRDGDDDDEEDDEDLNLNEDIVLEEDTTVEQTTEEILEKEELDEKVSNDLKEEMNAVNKNNTLTYRNNGSNTRTASINYFIIFYLIKIIVDVYVICF